MRCRYEDRGEFGGFRRLSLLQALTVHLSLNRCFDAETYADQAGLENALDIRDDQRSRLETRCIAFANT